MPAPPPSGFMLVSGGAQLEMETDSDDEGGDQLTGRPQAGGGPLPSRAEDLLSAPSPVVWPCCIAADPAKASQHASFQTISCSCIQCPRRSHPCCVTLSSRLCCPEDGLRNGWFNGPPLS